MVFRDSALCGIDKRIMDGKGGDCYGKERVHIVPFLNEARPHVCEMELAFKVCDCTSRGHLG